MVFAFLAAAGAGLAVTLPTPTALRLLLLLAVPAVPCAVWILQFTAEMQGELTVDGHSVTLAELDSTGRAAKIGAAYSIPHAHGAQARGYLLRRGPVHLRLARPHEALRRRRQLGRCQV